jgi:hypothetical protein
MRPVTALLALLSAALPCTSRASGFEFCDLSGEITSVAGTSTMHTYDMQVLVVAAARARGTGKDSYTDCTEHIDRTMDLVLRIPRRAGTPRVADRIEFFRSAVDGFGPDGSFVGTSVQVRFLELRKGSQPEE